jgi:hypothetical protein
MLELMKQLKRARQLAAQVDHGMILYLLDMAILEANAKAVNCFDISSHRLHDLKHIRAKPVVTLTDEGYSGAFFEGDKDD